MFKSGLITLFISLFLILFISSNNGVNYETTINSFKQTEGVLFNVTNNTIKYTNLYENEITITKTIDNILHGIIYGAVVEINTLVPIMINVTYGKFGEQIFKIVLLILFVWIILNLINLIKYGILIYFFIKEKKKYKEKVID